MLFKQRRSRRFAIDGGLVVLPDSAAAARVFERVPHDEPDVVRHPSGRPWLVGRWSPRDLVVVDEGPVRVVLFGFCPVDPREVRAHLVRVRHPADLDALARVLPGCAHLVASVDGEVRFQGTIAGVRRVFTGRVDGVSVAGDRADVVAEVVGAEPDVDMLAVGSVFPLFIPPLGERSWWRGVEAVAPDSYLLLTRDGRSRSARWWTPPEPERSLAAGAAELRHVLGTAVARRKPAVGRLSADLSGGMDSTSLCFLAAEGTPDLLTFRWLDGSPLNDDRHYAVEAKRRLDRAEHLELAVDGGLRELVAVDEFTDAEEPQICASGMTRIRRGIDTLVRQGATTHLSGHGADELFTATPFYLHSLLRRKPWTALRRARVYRALGRWPLLPTIAALADRRGLDAWWRRCADELSRPLPKRAPLLDWASRMAASPWATPEAVDLCREVLRGVADEARPFAVDRGQHEAVSSLRTAGMFARQMVRTHADRGLRFEVPYLDDGVVEAALAVRTDERYTPWRFKPLLAEAMRGLVPDMILNRYTKGDYEENSELDMKRQIPKILELLEDSALAARGMIDLDAVRARLSLPPDVMNDDMSVHLDNVVSIEMWLRATDARSGGRHSASAVHEPVEVS
ncbi:asparagine synthase-related protein [Saccharothrix obliqua]|uniref:asparagine synthase-related protein n=1 Tax=Saccharothrix obliqua TaxID=2861747 RepID=UPI001C5E8E4A|nr:asparagine synthase-related protein [Saccharothrix obliqua]MBW4718141.1 asparagine synthase [Saccharothrix obliqua]